MGESGRVCLKTGEFGSKLSKIGQDLPENEAELGNFAPNQTNPGRG